jgi:hypothetical protein
MLSSIMLSVVMLNVGMLNVVAPEKWILHFHSFDKLGAQHGQTSARRTKPGPSFQL